MNWKRNILLALVAGASFQAAANAPKIGVVSLQRALQQTKAGQAAKASLEKEFGGRRKEIETKQKELTKLQEEFQKKLSVMSEPAKAEKQMEMQRKFAEYQEFVQKSQAEVQAKEAELSRPIIEGLREILPEVSREQKLDLVFDANAGLLYSVNQSDVTEQLIRLYDQKNPGKKK